MKSAYWPPLPAITLSKVRYLHNKLDELSTIIRCDGDYRRTSLFCFTETWLSGLNADIDIEGFTTIRFDRDKTKTKKSIGGGLCWSTKSGPPTSVWENELAQDRTKC